MAHQVKESKVRESAPLRPFWIKTDHIPNSAYIEAVENGFEGTELAWFLSMYRPEVYEGERKTGVHEGYLGQQSITDDYLYVCVKSGEAGEAIWKKTLLFQT